MPSVSEVVRVYKYKSDHVVSYVQNIRVAHWVRPKVHLRQYPFIDGYQKQMPRETGKN